MRAKESEDSRDSTSDEQDDVPSLFLKLAGKNSLVLDIPRGLRGGRAGM